MLPALSPQSSLIGTPFFDVVAFHSNSRVKYSQAGIPLINGASVIWSTELYEDVEKQFLVGEQAKPSRKNYHVKIVPDSEDDLCISYSRHFLRNLNKSIRSGLSVEIALARTLSKDRMSDLFNIFQLTMLRLNSFVIPQRLFNDLFKMDHNQCYVYLALHNKKIVAFQLQIGSILYLSGALVEYFSYGVNNLLLHRLYTNNYNCILYQGTSFVGSGQDRFKRSCGTVTLNCSPMPNRNQFEVAYHLNRLGQRVPLRIAYNYVLKRFRKAILYVMPYG